MVIVLTDVLLKMDNITKEFPGVKALDRVSLEVKKNTIHAIVGENGAGKSTLMKVLSGVYPATSYDGEIYFNGELCQFTDIKQSEKKGIVIIHQELALVPNLSVMENMFLGNERKNGLSIDWNKTRTDAMELMDKVGLNVDLDALIKEVGVGNQQLVEICKALAKDVKLLILDEPTASLNDADSDALLDLILRLREKHGISSIIISHKLNEIKKVADDITVIRDGRSIETLKNRDQDVTEDRIIKGMVGREITDRYPSRDLELGDIHFEIENWNVYDTNITSKQVIRDINIKVRKGEVVGIAGLMGAGRTEFAMSLFGGSYGSNISGRVLKDGEEIKLSSVREAIDNGLAYVTEDRKDKGLILSTDIRENISLASLDKISSRGILDENREILTANEYFDRIRIKAPNIFHIVNNLSGGNQQKVMLARWICSDPELLILDEPTRGIDVGAKYEIYTIINELARMGKSIIIISSELPEVIGMSDRIYVMNEGRIVGELDSQEATQENILKSIVLDDEAV